MDREAQVNYIEDQITDEDIEAWHECEMTEHLEQILNDAGVSVIQIWGSRDGPEPLTVIVIE